jgi:hypothetical protein
MAARVHRQLKVIAFNANGIWRQRYQLGKRLQDIHVGVALLSETYLKPHESTLFKIITFIVLTTSQEEKTELMLQ